MLKPDPFSFKKEEFMDKFHWMRYYLTIKLIRKNKIELKDFFEFDKDNYRYWIFQLDSTYMVVGTDDSQKLFTTFSRSFSYSFFYQIVFHFDYHWWQTEEIWKRFPVSVRLQGDLVVGLDKPANTIVRFPGFLDWLENHSRGELKLALRNFLPHEVAIKLSTKTPLSRDDLIDKLSYEEALHDQTRLRIIWRRHVIHARGIPLNGDTFLINPPRLIVYHPQHKKVIFPVKESVVMRVLS